jgi:chaperonin cofactor prefoldin
MKIQSWFRQLKQIKQEKDALREKKIEAAKAAKELGLSKEEIADRLQHVEMSKGSSNAHHAESHAEPKTPSALIQVEEGQSLGEVLARSSLEMESTEAAALDVMTGVQAFDAWKQNTNDSRESLVRGLVAKEVMEKRLESLRRSEQAINDRVSQLHHLLGVGSH